MLEVPSPKPGHYGDITIAEFLKRAYAAANRLGEMTGD